MLLRLVLVSFVLVAASFAAEPIAPQFAEALKSFKAEGAKGWAFVQTTRSRSQSLVERYDPAKSEFMRWTLLQLNGKPPSEKEAREYQEKHTRRSNNETAPDVTKQLDLATAEQIADDADRTVYRFHLIAGGKDDTSAKYMAATFTLHKPTSTIQRIVLANTEPFAPMMSVKIQEARTEIDYSLPTADRPSLLDRIAVRVRGRAMWVKSLDEDMTVVYSDYTYALKRPSGARSARQDSSK